MISCLDVHYRLNDAVAACLLFQNRSDDSPRQGLTVTVSPVAPYQPGQFYKRELPFITAAGCDAELAAENIRAMHGPFRLPTLLKRVDRLCRGIV
jgi:deoxyribonuclease V